MLIKLKGLSNFALNIGNMVKSDIGVIELKLLFEEEFGVSPEIKEIKGGGSSRKYYRLSAPEVTTVGAFCQERHENITFLTLNKVMESVGIKVPHIIAVNKNETAYLLQDLGDRDLLSVLKEKDAEDKMKLSSTALDKLIEIQTLPEGLWKDKTGWAPFNRRLVMWDLNYFKYDFLKPSHIEFDEDALEEDFEKIANIIESSKAPAGFMYRDFQSRNIMVKDGALWFIDFQGARKGPMTYDAVSFIWQAKAPFTFDEREYLSSYYTERLSSITGFEESVIKEEMKIMQLFRTLQVLGAYGFRGLIEKKAHFLESIPLAVENLAYLRKRGVLDDFPQIKRISESLSVKYLNSQRNENKELTLKVFSFSYKKGYPEDLTGNGGGFMFDCRAIHNPGRYDEYKSLTGKDKPVADFLEKIPEAGEFIVRAIEIVSPSVECYKRRGFTSLQVGFGCTGGQHRSVYCAENFTRLMKEKYKDLNIELIHREI